MLSSPQIDEQFNALAFLEGQSNQHGKKILICAFHQYPDALGALLEIVENTYKAGYEISVGLWAEQVEVADTCNSYSPLLMKLLKRKSAQNFVREIITELYPKVEFLELANTGKPKRYFGYGFQKIHVEEVQRMFPENPGKGYAIGASLIDGTRRSISAANFNKKFINKLSESYDSLNKSATELLSKNKFDKVILFNGRRTHDQALINVCKNLDVDYLNYEVGGSDGNFDLYQHGTHDRTELQKRMKYSYKSNLNSGAKEHAHEWFQRRRFRKDYVAAQYAAKQKTGTELNFKNSNSKKIGFYSSSTDELASVGAGWESIFGEQEDSIALVAQLTSVRPDIEFVLRTHPNMRNKSKKTKKQWNQFVASLPIDQHIDANSQLDSYALLDQLDGIIVHGSTVGVESTYWGKPVISLAPTFYDELGCVNFPKTIQELENWLDNLPEPNPQESALPYGFFIRTRGLNYRNYISDRGIFGTFKNFDVGQRNTFIRKIFEIENRLRRITW